VRAAGLRVPKDATPAERELADRALVRIADVMEEQVSSFQAFAVLTAARGLREEVCGKVADKLVTITPTDSAEVSDEEWAALSRLEHEVRGG
jgi:hypothetical protein